MLRSKKFLIGILAFLPLVATAIVFIYALVNFIPDVLRLDREYSGEIPPETFFTHMLGFILSAVIIGLLHLGLMIYFIINVLNNKQVKTEERIIWVLLFIFVNTIAFPVYWGMRIWPEEKAESNFIRM